MVTTLTQMQSWKSLVEILEIRFVMERDVSLNMKSLKLWIWSARRVQRNRSPASATYSELTNQMKRTVSNLSIMTCWIILQHLCPYFMRTRPASLHWTVRSRSYELQNVSSLSITQEHEVHQAPLENEVRCEMLRNAVNQVSSTRT